MLLACLESIFTIFGGEGGSWVLSVPSSTFLFLLPFTYLRQILTK